MPQPQQYTSAAQRQAAYRQRQAQAQLVQLAQKSLPPLPAVCTVPGQARWTALLAQAQWALSQVSQEMQEYYEARSETWQESERGEGFAERLEAVQEVLEAVAELDAADTKKSVKTLDGLPCMFTSVGGRAYTQEKAGSPCRWLHECLMAPPDALDARAAQDGLSEFASLDALPPMRNPTASLLVH